MQSFLEETRPDKRRRIVDRLLESPAYPTHFAGVLRAAIVPEANTDPQLQFQGAAAFDQWMRRRIAENAGYDRIARELLTAPVGMPGPGFYFVAKGGKPENIAAGAARVFLGVRIECAQCHNHPFAKWRREQFWQFAAFFAGIDRPPNGRIGDDARLAELKIPGLDKVVQARFLDDGRAALEAAIGSRAKHWRIGSPPPATPISRGRPSTAFGRISSARGSSIRSTTSTNRTRRAIRNSSMRWPPISCGRNAT